MKYRKEVARGLVKALREKLKIAETKMKGYLKRKSLSALTPEIMAEVCDLVLIPDKPGRKALPKYNCGEHIPKVGKEGADKILVQSL